MTTWKPDGPPMGFYGGQQDPPYPQQPGYPQQPPYPQQPGYPPQQPGYPQQGYPPPAAGYPYPTPPPPYTPTAPSVGFGIASPTPQPAMYGSSSYSEELGGGGNFEFSDKSIRLGFIRKVYGILMIQLLITFGMIAFFVFHKPTKDFVQHTPALMWVALAITFVCLIALACCNDLRRKTPTNFIFLGIFTLAEGFLLGTMCTFYRVNEILMAVGITAAVCLALTLFAFQTKWDFTTMGGILLVCTVVFFIFGIVAIFIPGQIVRLVYASIGALLFSVYLVYDTQLMMGGKHKYSISPEEYIFAALNLYTDVVNIFIYILTIIGAARGD